MNLKPLFSKTGNIEDALPHCKLPMRTLTPLFRALSGVEMVTITLDTTKNELIIEFKCRQKVTKIHYITVLEFKRLRELKMPDIFPNRIIGTHKTFSEIVTGFHSRTRELCIDVTRTSINIRNHIDNPDEDKHTIRASHQLMTGEFETFSIAENQRLSYALQEFRAIINFAELIESSVKMEFGAPGSPMRVAIRSASGDYTAMLFCATMAGDESVNDSECYASSTQTSAQSVPPIDQVQPPTANSVRVEHQNGDLTDSEVSNPPRPKPSKKDLAEVNPLRPDNANLNNKRLRPETTKAGGSLMRQTKRKIEGENFPIKQRKVHSISLEDIDAAHIPQAANIHEIASDALTPDIAVENLPESSEMSNPPPPPVFIAESDLQESEPASRKTIAAPESVEILFETESTEQTDVGTENSIPCSPTRIKKKRLFKRCFESTFRPSALPGADVILAPNSDDEN